MALINGHGVSHQFSVQRRQADPVELGRKGLSGRGTSRVLRSPQLYRRAGPRVDCFVACTGPIELTNDYWMAMRRVTNCVRLSSPAMRAWRTERPVRRSGWNGLVTLCTSSRSNQSRKNGTVVCASGCLSTVRNFGGLEVRAGPGDRTGATAGRVQLEHHSRSDLHLHPALKLGILDLLVGR